MSCFLLILSAFLIQWRPGSCLFYYWVDSSCKDRIDGVIDEAIMMAASASFRLGNPQDQNQHEIFAQLFITEPGDQAAIAEVQRVMGGIGEFRSTLDRPSSDVRIYCDADMLAPRGRWTVVPDVLPDSTPNSRRIFGTDQEIEDRLNALGRATDTKGCQDPGTQAETYFVPRNPEDTVANQNPFRSTITLCERVLKDENDQRLQPMTFSDINPQTDIGQSSNIEDWEALTSVILLHEFAHTNHFGKSDVKLAHLTPDEHGQPPEAIGWELANEILTSTDALKNADTYALFGLFARFADFHYRLDSAFEHQNEGRLVYDGDLLPADERLNSVRSL